MKEAILFLGAPLSGKTTAARRLGKEAHLPIINAATLPSQLVVDHATSLKEQRVIFNGFPRQIEDIYRLDDADIYAKAAFWLIADLKKIERRGKDVDHSGYFHTRTLDVIEHYYKYGRLFPINANHTKENVYQDIKEIYDALRS